MDFYIETAGRLLLLNQGSMPAQFIGPKLLTALSNIAVLPVMESAGMLSPMVIKDMLKGSVPALDLVCKHSPQKIAGANLCISSCEQDEVSGKEMECLIETLINTGN